MRHLVNWLTTLSLALLATTLPAALIDLPLTSPGSPFVLGTPVQLRSQITVRTDTIADVGQLIDWSFSAPARSRSFNLVREVGVVPADFPNPPQLETRTWRQTWALEEVADLPDFTLLGDPAPIVYAGNERFNFLANVNLTFPSEIAFRGVITIDGPQTDVTHPFTVVYRLQEAATRNFSMQVSIDTGDDFPDSARVTFNGILPRGPSYNTTTPVIFDQLVDGERFRFAIEPTVRFNLGAIPEPQSWGLAALAIGGGRFGASRFGRKVSRG